MIHVLNTEIFMRSIQNIDVSIIIKYNVSSELVLSTTPFSFQIKITLVQIKINQIKIKIITVQFKIIPVRIKIILVQINIIRIQINIILSI